MKVYLATSGEYSDYCVRHVFRRREDADAYPLADATEEFELHEGPVDARHWHSLTWRPNEEDRELTAGPDANPYEEHTFRDFDGDERRCEHQWAKAWDSADRSISAPVLYVRGWNLERVRKVYSEQRAQYTANKDMGITP